MEVAPDQIDSRMLVGVVQQALNSHTAMLDTWHMQPIDYTNVSSDTRGLYRVAGTARDGGITKPWSVVLKVFAAADDSAVDDPSAAFYWKREALAYASGLLPNLSGGLRAPRRLETVQLVDHQLWLWLEDVQPARDGPWSIDRYGLAADHFGLFGGAYLAERPLPTVPWLSQHLMRTWVADSASLIEVARQPDAWNDPLLQRSFPASVVAAVLRLWAEQEVFFAQLERLSQTLCHHDVWHKNLFTRMSAAGIEETIAIDWELVGVGAAGEDVGNLLGVSLLNFDVEANQASLLKEALFTQYLDGLCRAGWQGKPDDISFAFNTAAALRCIFSAALWPVAIMQNPDRYVLETKQRWGRPIEDIFEHWAAVTTFLLDCAHEARATCNGPQRRTYSLNR
jgi:hypothetical protein